MSYEQLLTDGWSYGTTRRSARSLEVLALHGNSEATHRCGCWWCSLGNRDLPVVAEIRGSLRGGEPEKCWAIAAKAPGVSRAYPPRLPVDDITAKVRSVEVLEILKDGPGTCTELAARLGDPEMARSVRNAAARLEEVGFAEASGSPKRTDQVWTATPPPDEVYDVYVLYDPEPCGWRHRDRPPSRYLTHKAEPLTHLLN